MYVVMMLMMGWVMMVGLGRVSFLGDGSRFRYNTGNIREGTLA